MFSMFLRHWLLLSLRSCVRAITETFRSASVGSCTRNHFNDSLYHSTRSLTDVLQVTAYSDELLELAHVLPPRKVCFEESCRGVSSRVGGCDATPTRMAARTSEE